MPIKKFGLVAAKTVRNALIGGVGGAAAGGFTSHSGYKEEGAKQGAVVGALAGAIAPAAVRLSLVGGKKAVRNGYARLLMASRKLGKNPGFDEGKIMNAVAGGIRQGRVTYRKIRGRIVPIRMK